MKRFLACLLTAAMAATLLFGCGQDTLQTQNAAPAETQAAAPAQTQAAAPAQTQAAAPAETQAAAPAETQAPAETEAPAEEEIAELEMMFWTLNTIPTEADEVEAALNEILEKKINAHINLNIIEMGSYIEQVNLMLASGEKLDLLLTLPGGPAHFNVLTSQNELMDITDLVNEYGQEMLAVLPEDWIKGTMVDGRIYSITSFVSKSPFVFACRSDILEETGIDISTVKTEADFTALFARVKELHPDMSPLVLASQKFISTPYLFDTDGNFIAYDDLGEGDNAILSLMDGDNDQIQNCYAREEYLHTCEVLTDWYNAGYLYKDGAMYKETAQSLVKQGIGFGYFGLMAPGTEASESAMCGYDITISFIRSCVVGTGSLRKFSLAVPVTSTEPEAAVKFMNLLYTDEEVANLVYWGVEGKHYQVMEDGTIDFLPGQDASNCGYYIGEVSKILGNGFLAKVRTGMDPNIREELKELNYNAQTSKYMGFGFVSDGLENEISLMTNTIANYRPSFSCGLYTQEYYDEFMQKLKDDGVDKYIAAVQEQLDAWLAEQ